MSLTVSLVVGQLLRRQALAWKALRQTTSKCLAPRGEQIHRKCTASLSPPSKPLPTPPLPAVLSHYDFYAPRPLQPSIPLGVGNVVMVLVDNQSGGAAGDD
eukprot:763753-Hanusia_phi.AAC.2